jgi:hypothetical protein
LTAFFISFNEKTGSFIDTILTWLDDLPQNIFDKNKLTLLRITEHRGRVKCAPGLNAGGLGFESLHGL